MARFILDVPNEDMAEAWELFKDNFGGIPARLTIVDETDETTFNEDETKNVLTAEQVERFNKTGTSY